MGRLCYTNRSNKAKAIRVWGFPVLRVTRGAKQLRSRERELAKIIHRKEKPRS